MENGAPKPMDQVHNFNHYAHDGKIMLFSGIILFGSILVVLCFHGCIWRILIILRRRHRQLLSLTNNTSSNNVAASQGLDPSILKALPVLVYCSATHDSALECAVCLSEFQDGEKGRVLPKCKHTFHICCIDLWFRTHSNCPLCRAPVQYDSVTEICAEIIVPVVETSGLPSEFRQNKEDERQCCASSSPEMASLSLLQCQRISPDLVGIVVEVPTSTSTWEQRLMGFDPSDPIRPKSPGDPALSL